MIENGTILQNRYTIEKQIGAGGMGAVYLAVDGRFENYVAIKETFLKNDEFGDAFEREAKLLNNLMHPVLPHVSDYFTEGGGHFLVMQFIEGEDLSDILKREGAFPVANVLRWTNSLLDALDYLHSQMPPIIHRDIKPQNLKLTPRGDIILLDFGLAKLNSEDISGVKSVFGYSRKYSPLEQIQGTGTDARSDIFALGATMYHLLTGKPPLDALTRAAAIVAGSPDPLQPVNEINAEVPFEVAQVLHTAMKLNADQRFASAKAARQALEHALNADVNENTEELPEQAFAAAASGSAIINSAETESFPALEAFVAAENLPQTVESATLEAAERPISNIPTFASAPENFTQVTDVATRVSIRPKRSRFPLAAVAVLLACAALAAGYFINKTRSSDELNQTQIVQPTPELAADAQQSAPVSDLPTTEVSDSSFGQVAAQAKAKPRPVEKPVEKNEKKESLQESPTSDETAEKPKPAQNENPRPPQTQNARRSQPRNNGEERSRVVENAPVPDIESVFTGQPTEREKIRRQDGRQRQDNQISDDEYYEMRRRQREQRRRERQNRPTFPF
ncbi:MAG: protein kinase [Acidobacteriota bacterium]|nr:protein kinase [Acidobacteriota bacterium]